MNVAGTSSRELPARRDRHGRAVVEVRTPTTSLRSTRAGAGMLQLTPSGVHLGVTARWRRTRNLEKARTCGTGWEGRRCAGDTRSHRGAGR
jgi:hypothetical protein